MDQPQTTAPPVNRIRQWRYRTAVQAARMLNSTAREQARHRGTARVGGGPAAGHRPRSR
jgi:hypothetical protein